MVLMTSQFGRARYANTIVNRTIQSGGSVGGNKKPGTVTYGPTWSRGNQGNYLRRAPQGCCNTGVVFALTTTTKHPLQYRRGSYAVTHSGMLG